MNSLNGTLIVIDGADVTGKTTQTALLADALRGEGQEVTVFDFPRYEESFFGRLVKRALSGEFGDFKSVSPHFSSWLYTLDRVTARASIEDALARSVVLCNRYVSSNIAYQAAKLPEGKQDAFIETIEEAEYDELGIPHPGLVVCLSVPPAVSRALMEREGRVRDLHEEDISYQECVNAVYARLARERPNWLLLECASGGELLGKEEIHEVLLLTVEDYFNRGG